MTPPRDFFCDNWSFPACDTQEVGLDYTLQNVSTPPRQYFDISHGSDSQSKATIITDTLSFYGNAERELQSHAARLASLHEKDLGREPETQRLGSSPIPNMLTQPGTFGGTNF